MDYSNLNLDFNLKPLNSPVFKQYQTSYDFNTNTERASVDTSFLQDQSVTNAKIVNLTANKITAGTITSGIIYAGTIAGSQVTAGTISATVAYLGTINANQLTAGTINGLVINGGTVTGATIQTASSGARILMSANSSQMAIYDSNGDLVGLIDEDGTSTAFRTSDSRRLDLVANNGSGTVQIFASIVDLNTANITNADTISFNSGEGLTSEGTAVTIASGKGLVFLGTQGNIDCGNIDCNSIDVNNNDIKEVNSIIFNDTSQYIDGSEGDDLRHYFADNCEFYKGGNIKAIIDDNIFTEGDLLANGSKPFLIPHPDGSDRLLKYTSQESPDVVLKVRGTHKIKWGVNDITVPEHFTLITEENGLNTVQITKVGTGEVTLFDYPTNSGFKVTGDEGTVFMWELSSIRKGYLDSEVEIGASSKNVEDLNLFNKMKKFEEKKNSINKPNDKMV